MSYLHKDPKTFPRWFPKAWEEGRAGQQGDEEQALGSTERSTPQVGCPQQSDNR